MQKEPETLSQIANKASRLCGRDTSRCQKQNKEQPVSRSEEAWRPVNERWQLYPITEGNDAIDRLRETLRRLQEVRLPIVAIDLIAAAVSQAHQAALETSWCPNCDIRGDGTVECSKCGHRTDSSFVDSINGECFDCQDADEDA